MNDLSRPEVDAKIAVVEAKVDTRVAHLETYIKTGFAELRVEMAELRVDMHKNTSSIIKWVLGALFAFSTLTIGTVIHVVDSALDQRVHTAPAAAPAPRDSSSSPAAQPAPTAHRADHPAPAQPSADSAPGTDVGARH